MEEEAQYELELLLMSCNALTACGNMYDRSSPEVTVLYNIERKVEKNWRLAARLALYLDIYHNADTAYRN